MNLELQRIVEEAKEKLYPKEKTSPLTCISIDGKEFTLPHNPVDGDIFSFYSPSGIVYSIEYNNGSFNVSNLSTSESSISYQKNNHKKNRRTK